MIQKSIHPSWHFYAGIVGILVGIITDSIFRPNFYLGAVWLLAAGLLWFGAICYARLYTIIFAILAGLILAHCRVQIELSSQEQISTYFGVTIQVIGKITDDPEVENGTVKLHLGDLKIDSEPYCGSLYVQLSTSADLERSDLITLEGKLTAGFGTYVGSLYRPKLLEIQKPDPPDYFVKLKHWFSETVHDYIAAPAADLGLGYLMGQKSGLPESLLATLQLVGMTHVVVASGAHLGILVNVAKKFFGKLSKFAGTFAALLMMGFFVMIVGFTPSMTRAALVAALSLLVGYFGRQFSPWRLLLLVAAITLLINPSYLIHLGWQLSFASFFGILILGPLITKLLYGGKKAPWLASMLITSIATCIVCAPILIYSFGSISFLALVANLIILPTLPYAMLLVFLTGATSFFPFFATLFGRLATWLLEFHIVIVNILSTQKSFILELPSSQIQIFGLYLPVITLILCYNIKKYQRVKKYGYSLRE